MVDVNTATGYVISDNEIVGIRITDSGTVVAIHTECHRRGLPGGMWYFAKSGEERPVIYETYAQAKAVLDKKIQECSHSWVMLSHEERQCRKCGTIEFIPDY